MPLFKMKNLKVKTKSGRGEGDDGLIEMLLDGYDGLKETFDQGTEAEKKEFVDALNEFKGGLGDAFAADKIDFESEATDITDATALMKKLGELGAIDFQE